MRFTILAVMVACSGRHAPPATGSGSATATERGSATPTVAREPMPDPITKPLGESEARTEATRLARAAFAGNPNIRDAAGVHLKTPAFEPTQWIVKHDGTTWKLDIDPPGGAYAHVTFGAFGGDPEIDVGFATE